MLVAWSKPKYNVGPSNQVQDGKSFITCWNKCSVCDNPPGSKLSMPQWLPHFSIFFINLSDKVLFNYSYLLHPITPVDPYKIASIWKSSSSKSNLPKQLQIRQSSSSRWQCKAMVYLQDSPTHMVTSWCASRTLLYVYGIQLLRWQPPKRHKNLRRGT